MRRGFSWTILKWSDNILRIAIRFTPFISFFPFLLQREVKWLNLPWNHFSDRIGSCYIEFPNERNAQQTAFQGMKRLNFGYN